MTRMNEEFPAKKLELVLFADALKHLLRLNRLLEMPRGSALLVGVGGSGKQSLTRLASYMSRSTCFQVCAVPLHVLPYEKSTASLLQMVVASVAVLTRLEGTPSLCQGYSGACC